MGRFCLKMTCRHNFESTLGIFLKFFIIRKNFIYQNKRSQKVHETSIIGFSEKIPVWGKSVILDPELLCIKAPDPF